MRKRPWPHLLFEAARVFLPPAVAGVPKHMQPAFWLHPQFAKRQHMALTGYPSRVRLLGPLPTFQENLSTFEGLRRQLACSAMSSDPHYEKRYPYLDRDLLEFLYAIPREQLVRPGQRRSIMRRALANIVPEEVLNRRRKAFVARSPIVAILSEWTTLTAVSQNLLVASLGFVDSKLFTKALQKARNGDELSIVTLMRTLWLEFWLRACRKHGTLGSKLLVENMNRPPLPSLPAEASTSNSAS
jgi:asparagine synthase (glutamine-hydrolysing)